MNLFKTDKDRIKELEFQLESTIMMKEHFHALLNRSRQRAQLFEGKFRTVKHENNKLRRMLEPSWVERSTQ